MKLIITTLLILSLLFLACEKGDDNNDLSKKVIIIQRNSFSPEVLLIHTGTTVKWINYDGTPHSVYSPDFESGALVKTEYYEHVFDTPGTYEYTCSIHKSEKGKIIVEG